MKVFVLTFWRDGHDLETGVFATQRAADAAALPMATELWDDWVEADWPEKPETWQEIYQTVLDHAGGCMDYLEVEEKEVQG